MRGLTREDDQPISVIIEAIELRNGMTEPNSREWDEGLEAFWSRHDPPEVSDAVKWLETKMGEIFPNETLWQSQWEPHREGAPSGPTRSATTAQTPFEDLQSHVALLEIFIDQFRDDRAATPRGSDVGIGHNQGPDLGPMSVEDIDDVKELVRLLKEQSPVPPQNTERLIEQSKKANRVAEKLKHYLDELALEFSKKIGGELGKRVAQVPFWTALLYYIWQVTEALTNWLAHGVH